MKGRIGQSKAKLLARRKGGVFSRYESSTTIWMSMTNSPPLIKNSKTIILLIHIIYNITKTDYNLTVFIIRR